MKASAMSAIVASWARALARAARWQYLVVFLGVMLVPAGLAFFPYRSFFGSIFDASPHEPSFVGHLDSPTFVEVLRQLSEPSAGGVFESTHAALVVALLAAPFLAGAGATLARVQGKQGKVGVAEILAGAAGLFPRMVRMVFVSILPLGIAGGAAALAFHLAGNVSAKATLESASGRAYLVATLVSAVLVWLFSTTVDVGRAYLAAEGQRRSAFLAWWSGAKLTARRPVQVLGLSLATTLVGVGGALVVTAMRTRLAQAGFATVAVAGLLGQIAVAIVAWGRGARLVGLVALIRDRGDG